MDNIRDWCISRQIWWGHRIPVWYCEKCLPAGDVRDIDVTGPETKGVYAGPEAGAVCPDCGGKDLRQDPDVLDTWFSSWLWPFSTLGWPEDTKECEKFYPTDVLVTAPEIIFFWVARMIMAGIKFMGDIPFSDVYIHGTVRDSSGTKMSKSLGNVIDPLDIIDEFGSDALRFSIISITSRGQDVFLSKEKFEIGRNFSNKIWNASRYVLMNLEDDIDETDMDPGKLTLPDKWILHELNEAVKKVTSNLEKFRFNEAASVLYEFTWHKYCDWYLEMSKIAEDSRNTGTVLILVLKSILKLLHPFMPFITEEIWKKMPGRGEQGMIMISRWPSKLPEHENTAEANKMSKVIEIITSIRNIRSFWNIPHGKKLDVYLSPEHERDRDIIRLSAGHIENLAGCSVAEVEKELERPQESVLALAGTVSIYVPLSGAVDLEKEKERVGSRIEEIEKYLFTVDKKLSNSSFLSNAPEKVIAKERAKKEKYEKKLDTLKENLSALK
jgi:valyl-tRNA synthetase